jgi:hypothetical protein
MIQLSINPKIVGKPPKGSNVNLGYDWMNVEAEWPDVFKLIIEDGYATSAALNSDNRKEANFVSRQLIMVDIDSGMTIPELFTNEFYNAYGAGFYATPSFTAELHKFRICFILEQAETDSSRLRKINRGLLKVFEQADEACKDPCRIFYGNPGCLLAECTDKLLTNDAVAVLIQIVEEQDAEQAAQMTEYANTEYPPLTDARRQKIITLLRGCFAGQYAIWRNIGWGLKAGGFSLQDFQQVTAGMMNAKTPADAANVWRAGNADGAVTMGSVIHFLKQRCGDDCLKDLDNPVVKYMDTNKRLKEKYNLV